MHSLLRTASARSLLSPDLARSSRCLSSWMRDMLHRLRVPTGHDASMFIIIYPQVPSQPFDSAQEAGTVLTIRPQSR